MEKADTPDPEGTKYFRAVYKLKKGNIPGDCQRRRDAYLTGLIEERRMRAAGPYVQNPLEGLSIQNASEAEDIMKDDPYVRELGAEYQVIQWDPKFGNF